MVLEAKTPASAYKSTPDARAAVAPTPTCLDFDHGGAPLTNGSVMSAGAASHVKGTAARSTPQLNLSRSLSPFCHQTYYTSPGC